MAKTYRKSPFFISLIVVLVFVALGVAGFVGGAMVLGGGILTIGSFVILLLGSDHLGTKSRTPLLDQLEAEREVAATLGRPLKRKPSEMSPRERDEKRKFDVDAARFLFGSDATVAVDPELQAYELHDNICTVLLLEWDPLRVSKIPERSGEYDQFAPDICELLCYGHDVDEIAYFLAAIQRNSMPMSRIDAKLNFRVAEKLYALMVID